MQRKNLVKSFIHLGLGLLILGFSSCEQKKKEEKQTSEQVSEAIEEDMSPFFKLSLAQWSLHRTIQNGEMDPMDFAQVAKEMGFEGLEYVTQLYPQIEEAAGKSNFREEVMKLAEALNERSKEAGMDNVLIMVDHAGELADPDPEKRKEAIENHKIWMDAAALMGAHSIRANLFGIIEPEAWHEASVASLKELATYGASVGVNIIIENHGGNSSHGARLAAVMKEVNMPTCGTLPDYGNFCVRRRDGDRWGSPCVEEYDRYLGTEELMPFAKGVSAKSHDFDETGNEVNTDYKKMLDIVKNANYNGYIGVEYEGSNLDEKEGIIATRDLLLKAAAN